MPLPRHELTVRLARIEGQVAAIKHLVESDTNPDCARTLVQIKAASEALRHVGKLFAHASVERRFSEKKSRTRLERDIKTVMDSTFIIS